MADYLQGFMGTALAGVEARNDITVCVRNWFANRNPLVTRIPNVPVDRVDFVMYTHPYRGRATTLGVAIASNATTALTVADATFLMNHDIIELVDSVSGNREFVQVNGDPTTSTTINVTRGVAGTTALSVVTINSPINVIGNSRSGDEVSQSALTSLGTSRTQYCQTFQFPVSIGGSAQTTRAMVLPGNIQSPFDFNQTLQLQNMIDDLEVTSYYGKAQAPVDGSVTAKCNGLRSILTTNTIGTVVGTPPTNSAAYASTDLIHDTLQAARANGGEPDLLIVSTNFMSGFATWGQAVMRIPAGETIFGVPINTLEAPFLNGITIVEAPLLRPFTAICLTSSEVYMRFKRNVYWNQRGNRGDRLEGEWITEAAIEVQNESHHAWVEGITAFSAN